MLFSSSKNLLSKSQPQKCIVRRICGFVWLSSSSFQVGIKPVPKIIKRMLFIPPIDNDFYLFQPSDQVPTPPLPVCADFSSVQVDSMDVVGKRQTAGLGLSFIREDISPMGNPLGDEMKCLLMRKNKPSRVECFFAHSLHSSLLSTSLLLSSTCLDVTQALLHIYLIIF